MAVAKVGVLVISYNHGRFIEKCLRSIVGQVTEDCFTIDLIIADDGSTDETLQIIERFQETGSHTIQVLESDERKGVKHNVFKLLNVTGYDYLGLIDGDDYWDYDRKLLEQVKFLEENQEFIGSCHDAHIIHQDKQAESILFSDHAYYSQAFNFRSTIYPWDVIARDIIPTSSIVFRQDALNKLVQEHITDGYSLAWKIVLFIIKDAKFKYFNKPWSVYRNHSGGISKRDNDSFHWSHIRFLKGLMKDDKYCYLKLHLYKAILKEYNVLIPQIKKEKGYVPLKVTADYLRCEFLRVLMNYRLLVKNQ